MEKTLEILQRVLEGERLVANDLEQLIEEAVKEGLYLEYKHGDLLKERDKANNVIREYMSAFANSDGGVLIIGIREEMSIPVEVTGCNIGYVGNKPLDEWANSCITGIAGQFTIRPTFQSVS